MQKTFSLPCPCGESCPVSPRQAGGKITCRCGQTLEVPTLREMAQLKEVELSVPPRRPWGVPQSLQLLAALILLAATGVLIFLALSFPSLPTIQHNPELIQRETRQLPAVSTVYIWRSLRNMPLRVHQSKREIRQREMRLRHGIWMILAGLVAAGALGLWLTVAIKTLATPRPDPPASNP